MYKYDTLSFKVIKTDLSEAGKYYPHYATIYWERPICFPLKNKN